MSAPKTTTAGKRFVYLFQVAQELPPTLEAAAGPDSDIVFLSWRAPSSDPRSVYYPSSSWTQGRNRLLREVLGRDYLYFVFADDDIILELTRLGATTVGADADPWRVFEQFLLTHEPAIGCPHYDWHLSGGHHDPTQERQTLRFFDAIVNAFHREALEILLPYYDLLDEASECYSQNILCSLASDLYPGHVMQTNLLRVHNAEQRRGPEEFLLSRPEQLYLDALRDPEAAHRFRRQSYGLVARHPTWGVAASKGGTYARSDDDLARMYDLSHTLWRRRRELVRMPLTDPFFSSDADSERAQRWRAIRKRPAPAAPNTPTVAGSRRRHASTPHRAVAELQAHNLDSSRFYYLARDIYRALKRGAALQEVLDDLLRRVWPERVWRRWFRDRGAVLQITERAQDQELELLALALSACPGRDTVFVDVGAAAGEVLARLRRTALRKRVHAIGIDPVDHRAHALYSGYVAAAITDGPEGTRDFYVHAATDCSSLLPMDPTRVTHDVAAGGSQLYYSPIEIAEVAEVQQVPTYNLSTILRQYGLADEVIHYVKVDAQGSDLAVIRSLGSQLANVLFLRMETVEHVGTGEPPLLYHGQTTMPEDVAFLESAGFRLFNIARFGSTPEADLTFVNLALFRRLLPQFAR